MHQRPEMVAPTGDGTLLVRAIDAGGAPVVGVLVTALSFTDTQTFETDEFGQVGFRNLSPGEFNVVFQKQGYKVVVRGGIQIAHRRTTAIDLTLEAAPPSETPRPEAEAPGTLVPATGPRPDGAEFIMTPLKRLDRLYGQSAGGQTVAFSPDGALLLTSSGDQGARVWNVEAEGFEAIELPGDKQPVYDALFSPDGRLIATVAARGPVRLWDTAGPTVPRNLAAGAFPALRNPRFSRNGRWLAAMASDNTVHVWNMEAGGGPLILSGHEARVSQVAFSLDEDLVLTVSADGTARVWPVVGGDPVVIEGDGAALGYGAFSPDGRRVALVAADRTVRVWNADGTGEPIVLSRFVSAAGVAFSSGGNQVILVEPGGSLRSWRLTGRPDAPVVSPPGIGWAGTGVSIADETLLQLAIRDENLSTLFRGENFERAVLFEHDMAVNDVEVSPDGNRFVTASSDGTARVWPVDGDDPPVILVHDDAVLQALFSPQGDRVLTRDDAGNIRVWEVDGTGEPLLLRRRGDDLRTPVFSPDGRLLVAATEDGRLLLWPLTWAELLDSLRNLTTECLSRELRHQFLGETFDQADAAFAVCERSFGRQSEHARSP